VKGGGRGDSKGEYGEGEMGLWPTGYQKFGSCTMFTIFWAGEVFAPSLVRKDGSKGDVNVGIWLRERYIDMWSVIVKRLGGLEAVCGFQVSCIC